MTFTPSQQTPTDISSSTATDDRLAVTFIDLDATGRKDKVTLISHLAARIKTAIGNATTTVSGLLSAADKTKLNGIAVGATANAADAQLRDRSTHTGTQGVNTITGLLDGNSKILTSLLPALSLTDTFAVASQSEMLGLTAEPGDIAVRTDLSKSFILKTSPATTLANWTELLSPTSPVQSVAGKTGAVTLTASDITSGVFTDDRIPSSIARDSEIESLARDAFSFQSPIEFDGLTGAVTLNGESLGVQLASDVSITGGSISGVSSSPSSLTLPTTASTSSGQIRRNTNAVEYRDSTNATRILLNNLDNLSNLGNTTTARSNLKAVGNDTTGYPGATAIGLLLGISQANYDALPSSAQNDPSIVWVIS